MKYVIALLLLVLSASIFAGTPPVPPPPYDSNSVKDTSIALKNLNRGGAINGQALVFNTTTKHWGPGSIAATLSNADVLGDIRLFGHPRFLNTRGYIDTTLMQITRPTAPNLTYRIPDTFFTTAGKTLQGNADSTGALHPNMLYFPGGYLGYEYWCSFTLSASAEENAFIRVSHDGITWVKFPGCPDPILWLSQVPATDTINHFSDGSLIMGSDGALHSMTRGTGAKCIIYEQHTTDGVTWSSPVPAIQQDSGSTVAARSYISPAFFLDSNGQYGMLSIRSDATNLKERIFLHKASSLAGPWTFVDTVRQYGTGKIFPCGPDTTTIDDDTILISNVPSSLWSAQAWQPWHIGIVDAGPDQRFVLLTAEHGFGNAPAILTFGVSTDNGRKININSKALLWPSNTSAWDSTLIYKSSGIIEYVNGVPQMRILVSAKGETNSHLGYTTAGEVWRTLGVTLYFQPDLQYKTVEGRTVWARDSIPVTDSLICTFERTRSDAEYLFKDSSYDGSALTDTVWAGGSVPSEFYADSIIMLYSEAQAADSIDYLYFYRAKTDKYVADSLVTTTNVHLNSTTSRTRVAYAWGEQLAPGQHWKVKFRNYFTATGNRCLTVNYIALKGRYLRK